jgi:hypothetical protein
MCELLEEVSGPGGSMCSPTLGLESEKGSTSRSEARRCRETQTR